MGHSTVNSLRFGTGPVFRNWERDRRVVSGNRSLQLRAEGKETCHNPTTHQ
jgi:hypothetical protein